MLLLKHVKTLTPSNNVKVNHALATIDFFANGIRPELKDNVVIVMLPSQSATTSPGRRNATALPFAHTRSTIGVHGIQEENRVPVEALLWTNARCRVIRYQTIGRALEPASPGTAMYDVAGTTGSAAAQKRRSWFSRNRGSTRNPTRVEILQMRNSATLRLARTLTYWVVHSTLEKSASGIAR